MLIADSMFIDEGDLYTLLVTGARNINLHTTPIEYVLLCRLQRRR